MNYIAIKQIALTEMFVNIAKFRFQTSLRSRCGITYTALVMSIKNGGRGNCSPCKGFYAILIQHGQNMLMGQFSLVVRFKHKEQGSRKVAVISLLLGFTVVTGRKGDRITCQPICRRKGSIYCAMAL